MDACVIRLFMTTFRLNPPLHGTMASAGSFKGEKHRVAVVMTISILWEYITAKRGTQSRRMMPS